MSREQVLQEMVDSMSEVLKYIGNCAGVKEGDVVGLMAWAEECCCSKLKAKNDLLEAALKQYGRHRDSCDLARFPTRHYEESVCTCGLKEVLL